MTTLIRTTAGALCALALATGSALAADPPAIRIGWNQVPGHMAGMAWHDKTLGYLKNSDKTYVAKPIFFQGSGHQVTAIAAGQVDIAAVSPVAFVTILKKANVDSRIIADVLHTACDGKTFTQPFYARKAANINSLADLKGKKIGINSQGSATDMSVLNALSKGNLTKDDATRIELKFSAMAAFLKEGKIDVGGFLPQFVPDVANDPAMHKVFDACVGGPVASVVLAASTKFIKENRAALVDMMADQMRAVRWFWDPANRDKVLKVVTDVTKAPVANFKDYVFIPEKDYARSKDLRVDPAFIQNAIDEGVRFKRIDAGVKATEIVDYSIIEDAKKQVEGK